MRTLLIASLLCLSHSIDASENIAPYFVPGLGDFTGFSIPENFQVGTSVYKLRGNAVMQARWPKLDEINAKVAHKLFFVRFMLTNPHWVWTNGRDETQKRAKRRKSYTERSSFVVAKEPLSWDPMESEEKNRWTRIETRLRFSCSSIEIGDFVPTN